MGIVLLKQALEIADSKGLDLVEVAPMAKPPVCRIMNYGKYRYEQKKKYQEAKKKQSAFQVKEIKVRPMTGDHDLEVKLRHVKRFLEIFSILFRNLHTIRIVFTNRKQEQMLEPTNRSTLFTVFVF